MNTEFKDAYERDPKIGRVRLTGKSRDWPPAGSVVFSTGFRRGCLLRLRWARWEPPQFHLERDQLLRGRF